MRLMSWYCRALVKKTVRDIIFIIKRGILMKRCIGMTGIVWKFKGGLK